MPSTEYYTDIGTITNVKIITTTITTATIFAAISTFVTLCTPAPPRPPLTWGGGEGKTHPDDEEPPSSAAPLVADGVGDGSRCEAGSAAFC